MLVPFVIDADGLTPDQAWTSAQQRACHRGLLDAWRRNGLLVHDGGELISSRLHQAIQALPQSVRSLWQEVLVRSPLVGIPTWNGSVCTATLQEFSDTAKLALVDDTCAEVEFGFDEDCDEALRLVNGVNVLICRLLAAGQAQSFQSAAVLAGSHIEIGDTFQATWDSRFQVLARAPIKLVSIVDRYAVAQHIACPQTRLSGLERFLRLLDNGASGSRHVTIYSAWTAELSGASRRTIEEIEVEMRAVFNQLTTRNIKRIKIVMVPNTCFRDGGHDRFVRFGDYVWDIGVGLEIFEGAFSAKRSSAGFKSGAAVGGYKRVEQDFAGNAEARYGEVR